MSSIPTVPVDQVTAPAHARVEHDPPPFARTPVLVLAAVVAVVHAVAATRNGPWFDEATTAVLGREHLSWGFADQPPLAPLLAALADAIAPGSLLALRVPAILATAGAVVVAALIAREFGGDRRAQLITAGAQATGFWFVTAGHWLTPYSLEPVQWLLLCWLLVRWVRVRQDRLLIVAGVVVGVGALTKFQILAFAAVLVLSVAVCGPRELLRRPALWAGAAIAAAIVAPTLVWQATNGWPQLHMGSVVSEEAAALYGGPGGIAIQMVVFAGIAGTVLVGYGTWRLLRAEDLRAMRFLGVAALVIAVLVIATSGRPYYVGGLYGVLAAAGAVGLQRRRAAGATRGRWVVWPAFAASIAVAAGGLALSSGMAPIGAGEQAARATADVYRSLPTGDRERAVLVTDTYLVAAYLDSYRDDDLPPAHSVSRAYGWRTPPDESDDRMLFVGDPAALRPYFTDCTQVGDDGAGDAIWWCTGRSTSWATIWERERTLRVL